MADRRVAASLTRAELDRARAARAGAGGPAPPVMHTRSRPVSASGVSEARRAWNQEHFGVVPELRCECAQPDCGRTVPAGAETHRGVAGRFIITPAHLNGGMVVRAADRFFVVEPGRHALQHPQGRLQ
jgi:hypothetical protein